MKHLLFILILLHSFSLTAQVPDSLKYKSLDPYYFHLNYLKEDKAILIDVREFFEYKKSRIINAVNVPSSGNLEKTTDTISGDAHLFLYCTTGYRSKRVAIRLYELGVTHLYNLEGGIKEWEKEGMMVDKKRAHRPTGVKAQGKE
jgi:rhodanese-related sulfurtransferase